MRKASRFPAVIAATLLLANVLPGFAQDTGDGNDAKSDSALEQEIQDLKQEVMNLNRDLFILEEEILFPSNTQVQFFVAMDSGSFFQLDSVQLHIDGKEVTNYLYTEREIEALERGGVHRLHLANLSTGEHEVVAHFTGVGPKGRDYRRAAELTVNKTLGPQYVEIAIRDDTASQQPKFAIRQWQ